MNKLILCTTGTSIANGCPSLRDLQSKNIDWNEQLPQLEEEIAEKIKKYDVRNEKDRRLLSAELNTLDRLNIDKNDKVVLLSTDNALGYVCSEENKKIIENVYGANVVIEQIVGLQVYDTKLLREQGLKNLVKIVLDNYLENNSIKYSYEIILNPTGGYKGIVPFLTILGMLYGKKAIYLFEFSESLIELPPLPLSFDTDIYERVKGALKFLEKEGVASIEAYLNKIDGYDPAERDLFLSFIETEDNLATLSPLAYVFLKVEENSQMPLVSKTALKQIEAQNGQKRIILERLIQNSANPLWRTQHMHRWPDSDFLIMKQGNTSERLAGFMKNGVFHIALAFANHDEYEAELKKYTVSNFDEEEFMLFEPKHIETDEELSTKDEIIKKLDLLKAEKKELEDELLDIELKYEDEKNIALEQEAKKFNKIKKELLQDHQKEIDKLKNKYEIRQKNFFTRLRYLFFGN